MSAEIKLAALDIGDEIWGLFKRSAQAYVDGAAWVGGALQGEFNTKATVGQIVVDAVISMFPVAGEVTAARDATAITLRMSESEEAAHNKWEWVSLVLCLLALVPLAGGVLKGVGRLTIRAVSKAENLVKLAEDILLFLRKMGYGDASKFLKKLDFAKYQSVVLTGFREVVSRISSACTFIVKKMGGLLPKGMQATLSAVPQRLERLSNTADRMIPEAFKELNAQLKKIQEALHDGSYIAPIHVGPKTSKVMVQEGRVMVEKTIHGPVQHPPASLAHYTHKVGWPDLKKIGEGRLPDPEKDEVLFRQVTQAGDYWPINTFSRNAPIVAHLGKPGDPLVRILDKEVLPIRGGNGAKAPKYKQAFHQAGDMWGDVLPPNGHWFRIKLAVKHAWNANGYFEKLIIPSRAQMQALGIHVPHDWDGMKLWKGTAGGQLDNQEAKNGFKEVNDWLEGGGTQLYIDFSHPDNAPVKEYLLKTVQTPATGWKDLQLPMGKAAEHKVINLEALERSAKIQQQGYVLRGAATAGKQSNNTSQQDK